MSIGSGMDWFCMSCLGVLRLNVRAMLKTNGGEWIHGHRPASRGKRGDAGHKALC